MYVRVAHSSEEVTERGRPEVLCDFQKWIAAMDSAKGCDSGYVSREQAESEWI